MIKHFFAVLVVTAVSYTAFSQAAVNTNSERLQVRFNPFGLIDFLDQNLSSGLEYYLNPNWSTGTDAGWIFYSQYLQKSRSANGLLLRPFIRYYPNKGGQGFFEAEIHYKYVSYKLEDWVGRLPVNNIPTYQEYNTFHYRKNVLGLHIKGGFKTNFSRNGKLKMELTGGLGVRWKWQGVKDGIYTNPTGITKIYDPEFFGVVVPMNLRLLYLL